MIRETVILTAIILGASYPQSLQAVTAVPSLTDAAGRYTITGSSDIRFHVDQVGGGGIKGSFGSFSGNFNLKAGDLSHSMVNFELKPQSVSTGQARVDAFLRSTAVFDTDNYDTITFRSNRIEQTGPDSAHVTGTLTAKGHTAAESFDVRLTSWNGRTIGFTVSGQILRSHYAMDVGTPIYSNLVQFDMMVEGQRN